MSQASIESIESMIVEFIAGSLARDEASTLDRDENLLTGGLIDSIGIVRLIAHLQDRLDVTIPPNDLIPDNFRTVAIMAAYLAGRQNVSPDPATASP